MPQETNYLKAVTVSPATLQQVLYIYVYIYVMPKQTARHILLCARMWAIGWLVSTKEKRIFLLYFGMLNCLKNISVCVCIIVS